MRPGVAKRILALLTAIAIIAGSLAQTTWLWQCRYASTVLASTIATTGQMPCHMAGVDMASMPCCRHMLTARADTGGGNQLQAPACDPKLVSVAVDSAARTTETHGHQVDRTDAPCALTSTPPIADHSFSSIATWLQPVQTSAASPSLSPPNLRGPPA